MTPNSIRGSANPWDLYPGHILDRWQPQSAGALFLGGLDWTSVPHQCSVPVINLIQGVRHAFPDDLRRPFLARPAVRICVSQEVADAISGIGDVNGPIHVIRNGIDLENIPSGTQRDIEVLIAGRKNPGLAEGLFEALSGVGVRTLQITAMLPRQAFLDHLARARVVITLPHREEGFFLPALEAMAAGAIIVCPDCTGNRGFCRNQKTAFCPSYDHHAILTATLQALNMPAAARHKMQAAALAEAQRHTLLGERQAFLKLLTTLSA